MERIGIRVVGCMREFVLVVYRVGDCRIAFALRGWAHEFNSNVRRGDSSQWHEGRCDGHVGLVNG